MLKKLRRRRRKSSTSKTLMEILPVTMDLQDLPQEAKKRMTKKTALKASKA